MEHQEGLEPPMTGFAVPRFVRFGFWCKGGAGQGSRTPLFGLEGRGPAAGPDPQGGGCEESTHTPREKRLSPCSGLPGCEAGPAGPSRG